MRKINCNPKRVALLFIWLMMSIASASAYESLEQINAFNGCLHFTPSDVYLKCHINAFKFFGGVPKKMLYDDFNHQSRLYCNSFSFNSGQHCGILEPFQAQLPDHPGKDIIQV